MSGAVENARLARLVKTIAAGILSMDAQWRIQYLNPEAGKILGFAPADLVGRVIWEAFPATVGTDFEAGYRRAAETGESVRFEAFYPDPLNAWYEVRAWPEGDGGLTLYFVDITAQRLAQQRLDDAGRRSELLAEITAALASTLDADEAVHRLADLVVPMMADWCVITVVDDEERPGLRGLRDVAWRHWDPAAHVLVTRYAELRLASMTDTSAFERAFRTGEHVLGVGDISTEIEATLRPGEARELVRTLNPGAVAMFPLRGRDRTVGVLTLINGASRGEFSSDDIAASHEVAGRAGLALDNLRLFNQQGELAAELQRSMLSEPPEPDHLHIVVRYQPAAEVAQVGGDWYDAFLQPDGATVVVIGDVVGHDSAAAAAMGQLRSMLRGIAACTGSGPAEVLRSVDRAIETLQVNTTATAIVGRLEQTAAEREQHITRLHWSNAGHPPPMVINTDNSVTVLATGDADLLLGFTGDSARKENMVELRRGSTLLLYTDGLVERRGQSLDDGLAELRDTLTQLADRTLDDLCDELLAQLLPERPDDDVALVAVRLHPQGRDRPAEAGPGRVPPNVPTES